MDENINKAPGPDKEKKAEGPVVCVKDVMEKVFVSVTPDIPIRDVFRIFIKHRLLAVPVVDEEDHLIGLISSADLKIESVCRVRCRSRWST